MALHIEQIGPQLMPRHRSVRNCFDLHRTFCGDALLATEPVAHKRRCNAQLDGEIGLGRVLLEVCR